MGLVHPFGLSLFLFLSCYVAFASGGFCFVLLFFATIEAAAAAIPKYNAKMLRDCGTVQTYKGRVICYFCIRKSR